MADLSVYQRVTPLNRLQELSQREQFAINQAKEQQRMAKELQLAKIKQMETEQASGGGGATGELIRLLQAEKPDLSTSDALAMIQTGYRKGLQFTPEGITPLAGYGESVSKLAGMESGATEEAKLSQQLQYAPKIEVAKSRGKSIGEAEALLGEMQAYQPKLIETVNKLSELGKKATYTLGGRVLDLIIKETGGEPRESAIARAEYISTVDNEILPLLRQTFGAAFTKAEGDSLRATLGAPNVSPQEKDAVLRAFIDNKTTQIQALKRQIGQDIQQSGLMDLKSKYGLE